MSCLIRAAFAAGLLAGTSAVAEEYSRFEELRFHVAGVPGCDGSALMNLPQDWARGDGAVLLLTAAGTRDTGRDGLVASLLDARTAVVELAQPARTACGATAGVTAADTLAAALDALVHEAGSGTVIALGYGPEAAETLATLRAGVADGEIGPATPGLAAAGTLGGRAPEFTLAGAAANPVGAEAPLRRVCRALTEAAGSLADTARTQAMRGAEACLGALTTVSAAAGRHPRR